MKSEMKLVETDIEDPVSIVRETGMTSTIEGADGKVSLVFDASASGFTGPASG